MFVLKLFIKHVKQMYLYIIGPDTDYANFAVFFFFSSLDIFIETLVKKNLC